MTEKRAGRTRTPEEARRERGNVMALLGVIALAIGILGVSNEKPIGFLIGILGVGLLVGGLVIR